MTLVAGEKNAKRAFKFTNDGHSAVNEAQGLGCCKPCEAWRRQCKKGLTCADGVCVGEGSFGGFLRGAGDFAKDSAELGVLSLVGGEIVGAGAEAMGFGAGVVVTEAERATALAVAEAVVEKSLVESLGEEAAVKAALGSLADGGLKNGALNGSVKELSEAIVERDLAVQKRLTWTARLKGLSRTRLNSEITALELKQEEAAAKLAKELHTRGMTPRAILESEYFVGKAGGKDKLFAMMKDVGGFEVKLRLAFKEEAADMLDTWVVENRDRVLKGVEGSFKVEDFLQR